MMNRPYELIIRATRPDDWEDFYAMRVEASVRYNTLAVPFPDPVQMRDRFSSAAPQTATRITAEALFADGTRKLAGQLALFRGKLHTAHSADMGIQVATEFQGQGVGTALMVAMCDLADNWLNLHRITLEVFTDNERGIALYTKSGFTIEATMTRYAFRDGAYTDAHKMGRIHPRHQSPALGAQP